MRRAHPRVPKCRLTRHDTVSGTKAWFLLLGHGQVAPVTYRDYRAVLVRLISPAGVAPLELVSGQLLDLCDASWGSP